MNDTQGVGIPDQQKNNDHPSEQEQTRSEAFGTVPNDYPLSSQNVRNASEDVRKDFGTLPNELLVASEDVPKHVDEIRNIPQSRAEGSEQLRNDSEDVRNDFGTVRNASEDVRNAFGTLPNELPFASEDVPNKTPELFRTAPLCSDDHPGFTITVREAAHIFEEANVPRTERAITNWCNRNTRGVIRLDCCYSELDRKYYITPESIEKVLQEERMKTGQVGSVYSEAAEELVEEVLNAQEETPTARKESAEPIETPAREKTDQREQTRVSREEETPRTAHSPSSEDPTRLKELQMENFELRIQLEGQKMLLMKYDDLVDGERQRHEREKMALVDRLTDARHQIGGLEQKLFQLEANNRPVRDAEVNP